MFMFKILNLRKRSQEEIFASYDWWNKDFVLHQITTERCDYIEACIHKVLGPGALQQSEILEIGCGGGLICEQLARRGAIMIGLDPSTAALAAARKHSQQSGLGHNIYYEQGYAESLPYADGSFSTIVCFDTLEHVHDLYATIKEIARVLAPGGIFVFDTINRTLIAHLVLIWIGEHVPFLFPDITPGLHHYNKFIKPIELQALITVSGLDVRELIGFMPRGLVHGRLKMGPGWFKGISYVGYATKQR
jgi:2-polyprenyl-6-hydroxyphenyl methylase / 3-demethylubiquinone-9 3-methyltransferase